MITALIRFEDDETLDWFEGPVEFPTMPQVGSSIRVIDKNANMQHLRVTGVIIEGVRPKMREALPNTTPTPGVILICS